MNDVVPKNSAAGVNVTCRPSVDVEPPSEAPAEVTVRPPPSGSMSLPSTAIVTGWPWLVVAESAWACGGGADGAVMSSATVAVAAWPAASVTVYWNESVRVPWSMAAEAATLAPSWANWATPSAGPLIEYVNVSSGSGSVTSADRSMLVVTPASTGNVASLAVGGRFDGGSTSITTEPA